jgi:hypothetical protein
MGGIVKEDVNPQKVVIAQKEMGALVVFTSKKGSVKEVKRRYEGRIMRSTNVLRTNFFQTNLSD